MKGRILKQLMFISQVPYLKHHDHAPSPPPPDPRRILGELPVVDSIELMSDLGEDDEGTYIVGSSPSSSDKENSRPLPRSMPSKSDAFSRFEEKRDAAERYRLPDPDSATLFDPELLVAFREAVLEHMRGFEEAKRRARAAALIERDGEGDPPQLGEEEPPAKLPRTDDSAAALNPLLEFEYRCPPGGEESAILYTTTLRGIRKTFEDCNGVRFLLQSLKIRFFERDMSMHLAFRKELWGALEGRAIPPQLFIRGRYIGGADEVLGLHEQGRLLPLLQEVPTDPSVADGGCKTCGGCAGVKFVVCWVCSGSRKVHGEEEELRAMQCQHCNENGCTCNLISKGMLTISEFSRDGTIRRTFTFSLPSPLPQSLPACFGSSANLSHVDSISTLGRLQLLQDSSADFSCRSIMEVFFSMRKSHVLSLSSSSSLPPPIPGEKCKFFQRM